jgi:predicted DNA-binding transcriptional regulator AlpA
MQAAAGQLEFLDFYRERVRPPGGGQVMDGFFVYHAQAQRADQVAYTLNCKAEHIYHHIDEGAFPNAADISTDGAARACWRIPREDVLAFIKSRKTGVRN